MDIEKELELPIDYSWELIIVIIEVLIIIGLCYLFYHYYWKIVQNYFQKPKISKLKDTYLKKLNRLFVNIKNKEISPQEGYYKLSKYIREFVNKSTGINVLNLSKSEIKKLDIQELSNLMEEYYPPEFSKYLESDIENSINKTKKSIESWE